MTTTEIIVRGMDLERFNIAANAKEFDCKFIEPGIIAYRDHQNGGIELLRKSTIDRDIRTAIGNPLTVNHVWVTHENRLEVEQGIIQDCYYDANEGWYHVKGVADTTRAQQLMKLQYPSSGYQVTSFGPGGVYNGIRYDREITGIRFNHLAIVSKPRYTDSEFRLNSYVSNPNKMTILKFLKKLVTRENGADGKTTESTKIESHEVDGTTEVEVQVPGGSVVTKRLNELPAFFAEQNQITDDSVVDVDGASIKVTDLKSLWRSDRVRQNEADKAKADADAKQKTAEDETRRQNDAAFIKLKTAQQAPAQGPGYSTSSGSLQEKLKRGSERY